MLGFAFDLKNPYCGLGSSKESGVKGSRSGLGTLNWGTQGRVAERQTWQDDLACFSSLGMGKDPARPWA